MDTDEAEETARLLFDAFHRGSDKWDWRTGEQQMRWIQMVRQLERDGYQLSPSVWTKQRDEDSRGKYGEV